MIDSLRTSRLQWFPQVGIGYYPVQANPYDATYWTRYRKLDQSPSGDALTLARRNLVHEYFDGPLVDVGIGGGRFVQECPGARGYDVNEHAIAWLKETGRWADPYRERIDAACFWDSLEHIHDPAPLLANIRCYAFVSIPIFLGPEHVLRSKHYKPEEHVWYFTADGLRWFMWRLGFVQCDGNTMEQACGREDIGTFVFVRRGECTSSV